jgi:hypothetical protein
MTPETNTTPGGHMASPPVLPAGLPILYEDDKEADLGESNPHVISDEILHVCLKAHLARRPEYQVFSNMNFYYPLDSRILGAICRKSFSTKRLCYMQSRSYYRESMFVSSCSIWVCDILPKNPRI